MAPARAVTTADRDRVTGVPERGRARTIGQRVGELTRERRRAAGNRLREESGVDLLRVRRGDRTLAGQADHERRSIRALRAGSRVVAGASFVEDGVQAVADFLVPTPAGYRIELVTTGRSPRTKDLLQAGVVAAAAGRAGITVAPEFVVDSLAGVSVHSSADAESVARLRAARLGRVLSATEAGVGLAPAGRGGAGECAASPLPAWGDPRWWACGYCSHCRRAIEEHRDVRLVWGLRRHHQVALAAAGIVRVEQLAHAEGPVDGLAPADLARLRGQARLQLRQEAAEAAGAEVTVFAEVFAPEVLAGLPEPSPGDVFFDFEGDPWAHERDEWGLEYLFGLLEGETGDYRTFWAHSLAEEKQALIDFLDYVRVRRQRHPDMHVYHYAFYEPETLRRLARRHGTGEAEVDELLAAGVFVDLYEVIKRAVHVSQRSFSLKKLEPLYMGDHLRTDDAVADGGASILAYEEATEARARGDEARWRAGLADLATYNEYDCLSTWRLRDWLLDHRGAGGGEETSAAAAPIAGTTQPVIAAEPAAGGEREAAPGSGPEPAIPAVEDAAPAGESAARAAEPRESTESAGPGDHGPRIEAITVEHRSRIRTAPEEAAAIVAALAGHATGPAMPASPLVVTLTEDQARLLRRDLTAAGLGEVRTCSAAEVLRERPAPAGEVYISLVASTLALADGGPRALLDADLWAAVTDCATGALVVVHSDQLLQTLPRGTGDFAGYAGLVRRLERAEAGVL